MGYRTLGGGTSAAGGTTSSSVGGLDVVKPGIKLANQTSGTTAKPLTIPGFKITQHTITNNGVYGASSQTGSGWTNPGNATGTHNGSNATVTGSATAATGGTLTLSFTPLTGKSALVISSVTLDLYGAQSGTTLGNGNYTADYSLNGGTTWTNFLPTQTGNFTNDLGNDLTAAVGGNWANLQNVKVRVTASYAAANLSSATLDAVELKVTASVTTIQ